MKRLIAILAIALLSFTSCQKSILSKGLYYAETNLTNMDLIAGAMNQALQASRRTLTSGGQGGTWLSDQFELSRQTMERIGCHKGVTSSAYWHYWHAPGASQQPDIDRAWR